MIDFENNLIYFGNKENPIYSYKVIGTESLYTSKKRYEQDSKLRTTRQLILFELEKYYFSKYQLAKNSDYENKVKLRELNKLKEYYEKYINTENVRAGVYSSLPLRMENSLKDKKYFYSTEFEDYKNTVVKPIIEETHKQILWDIESQIYLIENEKQWKYASLEISYEESLKNINNVKPEDRTKVIFRNIVKLLKRDYEYQKEYYDNCINKLKDEIEIQLKNKPYSDTSQLQMNLEKLIRERKKKKLHNYRATTHCLFIQNTIPISISHT